MRSANRKILPGFSLTLGYTMLYLSVLVLLPLAVVVVTASDLGWERFWEVVWTREARAAYALSIGAAFAAAFVNVFLGLLVAWVLVRYRPPRMILHLDERVLTTRALAVAVANGPYAGLGFTVAPRAALDDGKFDVVIFSRFSRTELITHFAAIAFGRRRYSAKRNSHSSNPRTSRPRRRRPARVCPDPEGRPGLATLRIGHGNPTRKPRPAGSSRPNSAATWRLGWTWGRCSRRRRRVSSATSTST